MALPSKNQQVAAVAKFLDSDRNEGRSLEEIAAEIVDGFHEALLSGIKRPATSPRLGMLFKTPLDAKIRRYVWEGDGQAWIVGETDGYGWLGKPDVFFEWCEEYRPKRYQMIDEKRTLVELTDEQIEEEWSNPDWKAGDVVSQHQRQHSFEIIATAPQSVLLRGTDGRLTVDENKSLEKYYRREIRGLGSEW